METEKLSSEEYHNWYKSTYKFISNINHESRYKAVVRGGEVCIIPVDEDVNKVKED